MPSERKTISVAVMSGKGGSGKTMIAALMAKILARIGMPTVLVDGDAGTAGLTFYLGLKQIANKRVGLINLLEEGQTDLSPSDCFQPFKCGETIAFLGLGANRLLYNRNVDLTPALGKVFSSLDLSGSSVIVDCRGGADKSCVDIGKFVDDIILVVEPDTTSFQATQYLVEMLTADGLGTKIKGFIINKVFDDPSAVARNGSGVFGGEFLAAVPFDIEAARSFLVGDIPARTSLCTTHVQQALHNAYGELVPPPFRRTLSFPEYRQTGMHNPDSQIGGFTIAFATFSLLLSTLVWLFDYSQSHVVETPLFSKVMALVILASVLSFSNINEAIKTRLGFIVRRCAGMMRRFTGTTFLDRRDSW